MAKKNGHKFFQSKIGRPVLSDSWKIFKKNWTDERLWRRKTRIGKITTIFTTDNHKHHYGYVADDIVEFKKVIEETKIVNIVKSEKKG